MKQVAVLLTCHNRVNKTISCLRSLYEAYDRFVEREGQIISMKIFLTDDGCTDHTASEVEHTFAGKNITIIQGDGSLYWAGGMRKAWREALQENSRWDYFLLLNDDTDLLENLFDELRNALDYSSHEFGKAGLISGVTTAKTDEHLITYGGSVWINKLAAIQQRVEPQGVPVECDMATANILLVPMTVVDKIGIFYDGYTHAHADYDYSICAKKAGFPVLITARACGRCDVDHRDEKSERAYILGMTFSQRKAFFSNPVHSSKDYLCYIRRNAPLRYPLVALGRFLALYCPGLYYNLFKLKSLASNNTREHLQ